MALPFNYSLRNIGVRRASAIFTAVGVAMTVAVFAGVISLRNGFEQLYKDRGRTDRVIYMRPGATSEGESGMTRTRCDELIKGNAEIARNAAGMPMAAKESYLAVYMDLAGGGTTNVPLRGIEPMSIELRADEVELVEGRWPALDANEVVVGRPLTERMLNCRIGDRLPLNGTAFTVVGVIVSDSAAGGEVWGGVERMMAALKRSVFQRVIADVVEGTDIEALSERMKSDPQGAVAVYSERDYLAKQTIMSGAMLGFLATFLTVIMGVAAVLGSMNTMLASVAARTHEIGVLLAVGYRRTSIFLAFLLEAALIGLLGGLLGLLIALPFNGTETGLMNWNTFTDVSFAFTLTPKLAVQSFVLAFVLGLIGGTLPAIRAARLKPVEAFRQL